MHLHHETTRTQEFFRKNNVKFWIDSAKKEHFYIKERDIKYEPENV